MVYQWPDPAFVKSLCKYSEYVSTAYFIRLSRINSLKDSSKPKNHGSAALKWVSKNIEVSFSTKNRPRIIQKHIQRQIFAFDHASSYFLYEAKSCTIFKSQILKRVRNKAKLVSRIWAKFDNFLNYIQNHE